MPDVRNFDVNGDQIDDLLWRIDSIGENIVWEMDLDEDNPILDGYHLPNLPGYEFGGSGEFTTNANQAETQFLFHAPSGETQIWSIDGDEAPIVEFLPSTGPGWTAHTGDFDGEGNTDILWTHTSGQNIVWEMQNGDNPIDEGYYLESTPGWEVGTIGDFDGDGDDDIAWQNPNGEKIVWELSGDPEEPIEVGYYLPTSPGWEFVGNGEFFDAAADATDDNRDDLLLNNPNGETIVWQLAADAGDPGQDEPVETGFYLEYNPGWTVEAVGDFADDEEVPNDIIWRSGDQTLAWVMDVVTVEPTQPVEPEAEIALPNVPAVWEVYG